MSKYNMQMFPQDIKDMEEEEIIEPVGYKIINGIKVIKMEVSRPSDNGMNDFIINLYNKYGRKFIIRLNSEPVLFEYSLDKHHNLVSCRIKTYDTKETIELFFIYHNKLNGLHLEWNTSRTKIKRIQTYINGMLVQPRT